MNEAYRIAEVEEYGLGIIKEEHVHYAVIEFAADGHLWQMIVENGDYRVVDEITIAHEEIR